MNEIVLDNVSRAFGRSYALHRVSMRFERGTLTVLLGPNGAGKTTLLNILATLDKPTSGLLRFGELDAESFGRRGRHNIGWVSHDGLVYDDLSGLENLQFFADMYGVNRDDCERWLVRVGLENASKQQVKFYSRGMRQRLSIARALLHNPPLVLLDEPLTGLDPAGQVKMLELFGQLRQQGRILVMITHDLDLPAELVDQVAVLEQGRLKYAGPLLAKAELLSHYN
jgi:heme exporter protein A